MNARRYVVLALLVLAAGCSSATTGHQPARPSARTVARPAKDRCVSAPTSTPRTAWQPITSVPAGYDETTWLASTPGKDDLWYVAAGQDAVAVFHWTPGGPTRSYTLDSDGAHGLAFGIDAGLAVAPGGDVWFGAGHTLVRLDPATGARTYFDIPVSKANFGQAIQGLAVNPVNGEVAISISDRQRVTLFDPATGHLSSLVLPAGEIVSTVTYAPDGTLGVETLNGNGSVSLLTSNGRADSVLAPSDDLVAVGSSFLAVGTPSELITPASAVTKIDLPAGVKVPMFGPAAGSPAGVAVAGTPTGFVVFDPARSSVTTLALPTSCVSGISPPEFISTSSTSSTVPPGPVLVHDVPEAIALDSHGDAFFTMNLGPPTIYEILASRL
jgi:streptogramin lyase